MFLVEQRSVSRSAPFKPNQGYS